MPTSQLSVSASHTEAHVLHSHAKLQLYSKQDYINNTYQSVGCGINLLPAITIFATQSVILTRGIKIQFEAEIVN